MELNFTLDLQFLCLDPRSSKLTLDKPRSGSWNLKIEYAAHKMRIVHSFCEVKHFKQGEMNFEGKKEKGDGMRCYGQDCLFVYVRF